MREKPGELLKKARESRGLSQDDVVKRLRLKLKIIQDIENDYYDDISATVYRRGYLRAYARLLDLKEDPILQAFSELHIVDPVKPLHDNPSAHSEEMLQNSLPWLRLSLFGLLGLLIIAALIVWWNQEKTPKKEAKASLSAVPATALIIPANPDTAQIPVVTEAPLAHSGAVEKAIIARDGHKKLTPRPPHHSVHKMAHKVLKPNYTLSPATESETH